MPPRSFTHYFAHLTINLFLSQGVVYKFAC
nr:MAG TPA: hypothetical protein [Caudoviricetes sp.]